MALWLLDSGHRRPYSLSRTVRPEDYDEPAAIALMQGPEWGVRLDLGLGEASTWVWDVRSSVTNTSRSTALPDLNGSHYHAIPGRLNKSHKSISEKSLTNSEGGAYLYPA